MDLQLRIPSSLEISMGQRTVTSARCEDCHRVYRIPYPDRTYKCKACEGAVRALRNTGATHGPVIEGTIACTDCHAINRSGAHFCVECGTVLDHWATVSNREEEDQLRHEAATALRRAYKWIGGVTWLYLFGALAYAVATAFAVGALSRPEVPLEGGLVVVLLTTSLCVLMLMGAMHILFRPFVWTVAIAALATVVSIVHLVGPNPFGVAFLGSALWAAVAWVALAPTFRFRNLIAEHTDLYILHHASKQTRRSLTGKFAKERHERLLAAMDRAARRTWKVSAAVASALCVTTALVTYTVVSNMRPQLFHEELAEFEKVWNETGISGLDGFFDPKVRVAETTMLPGLAEGHGWDEVLPRLENGQVRREEVRAWVDYELDGVPLATTWFLDGQKWRLADIELPVPPFEPVLESFVEAWRASDPRALAAWFSPDNRVAMTMSITASAKERGWESFPAIEEVDARDATNGETTVVLDLAKGKARTEWRLRPDGRWGLVNLKFPRRWKQPTPAAPAAEPQR